MKNTIAFLLLSQILISSTCRKESENCHQKIQFKNNSSGSIFIQESYQYPKTSLAGPYAPFPSPLSQPQIYEVKPAETNTEATRTRGGDCIETARFGTDRIPSGITMIYVFDANILSTVPWDTIRKHNMYLKRYDLSLQDLKNSNWIITYP